MIKFSPSFYKPSSKDLKTILEIEARCYKPLDQFSYLQFWYLINHGKGIFRMIEGNKGFFYFTSYKNHVRLCNLAIDPHYQRLGLGSHIIAWIENYCIKNRLYSIRLEVRKDNKKAIKFYLKHGFKKYDKRDAYYKDGTSAILMKKDLYA